MIFLHNCAVIKKKIGVLLVLRRISEDDSPMDPALFIPCIFCLGFVQKSKFWKHYKNCVFKRTEYAQNEMTKGLINQ